MDNDDNDDDNDDDTDDDDICIHNREIRDGDRS